MLQLFFFDYTQFTLELTLTINFFCGLCLYANKLFLGINFVVCLP